MGPIIIQETVKYNIGRRFDILDPRWKRVRQGKRRYYGLELYSVVAAFSPVASKLGLPNKDTCQRYSMVSSSCLYLTQAPPRLGISVNGAIPGGGPKTHPKVLKVH